MAGESEMAGGATIGGEAGRSPTTYLSGARPGGSERRMAAGNGTMRTLPSASPA